MNVSELFTCLLFCIGNWALVCHLLHVHTWLHLMSMYATMMFCLQLVAVYVQAYMHELRLCLLNLAQQPDPNLQNRLHRLTFEAIRLRGHSHKLTSGAITPGASVMPMQHAHSGCPFDELLV